MLIKKLRNETMIRILIIIELNIQLMIDIR